MLSARLLESEVKSNVNQLYLRCNYYFFSLILIPVNKKAVLWKGIGLLSYKKTLQSEIKINGPFVHAPAN